MFGKNLIATLAAMSVLVGCASLGPSPGDQKQQRYTLKDGSALIVDTDGRMRMFNTYGEPIYMKDGVAMELKNGTLITMKENVIWRTLRTRGTLNPRS